MPTEPKIRLVQPGVVRVGKPEIRAGNWLGQRPAPRSSQAMDLRDRKGWSHAAYTSSLYNTPNSHYSFYSQYRSLMPEQYWQLYKSTPDVRACVDSIARRISTWDWFIRVNEDPRNPEEYQRLTDVAARIRDFLKTPSTDGTTWQEMMVAVVTDLLVYDAGAIELVSDADGRLVELQSWLGSEWFPVTDEHGHLLRYEQQTEDTPENPIALPPQSLAYFKLYNNNRSVLGLPVLETVINECLTCVLSSEHAMLALDADEIPPGLLVLGGVAGQAAERARADLMSMKGKDHRIRVVTSPQPNGIDAKWLELRHTPKDLEMQQVVETMRRAIWRTFGVMPIELGESQGVPRATAEIQMDVASSHLISPILELLQARINTQVLPRLLDEADEGRVSFNFDRAAPLTAGEKLEAAKRSEILLEHGVITVNEVRAEMGMMPVEGGDVPTVVTALGPLPLAKVMTGMSPAETLPAAQQYGGEEKAGVITASQIVQSFLRRRDGAGHTCNAECNHDKEERKYENIDFSVPKGVVEELEKGLRWNEEGHGGGGLRPETVAWARRMANGADISPAKAVKMRAWLARHEVDKEGKGFYPDQEGFPSPGRVAWALWGGDPAVPWSNKIVNQMRREDEEEGRNLSDLSEKVQKALKKKADDFNEEMEEGGFAEWKRTTARTLAAVFKRGVGAYNTNPESVRPTVNSADQWAYARVNSFLYAVEKEKFRSGKHDTDLLPEEHPMSTKGKSWRERALDSQWLPSAWAKPSKFKDVRTVDLRALAGDVEDYTRGVAELYISTADEVQAIVASAIASGGGKMSVPSSNTATRRINEALDDLVVRWSTMTLPYYISVSKSAYQSCSEWMGQEPAGDPARVALSYHNEAMLYLTDSIGLVGTLRNNILQIVRAATLSQRSRADEVDPDTDPIEILRLLDDEFAAQSHRITNWSGKLVGLTWLAVGSYLLSRTILQDGSANVWYYEWVAQEGKNCTTCVSEGSQGIRRLDEISVYPAEDTKCGANCRCVLSVWTQREIDSGDYVLLSHLNE